MRLIVLAIVLLAFPLSASAQSADPDSASPYQPDERFSPRLYAGIALLSGLYGTTLIGTLALAGEIEAEGLTSLLPGIGPFIAMGFAADAECFSSSCKSLKTASIIASLFNGIGQIAGFALVFSALTPEIVLAREDTEGVSVSLRPASNGAELGASVELGWL
jgi:hypothetical protein